ncbi:hypothetical protein NKH48_18150 [Mesorhizobium sp. M1233]
MNDEVSHLTAGAAALLAETDEQRVRAIRSRRRVLYPRAKQALDRLSALLVQPRGRVCPRSRSTATAAWQDDDHEAVPG